MYLVAMEVLNDMLRLNILPALFAREPLDNPCVNLSPELLAKVSLRPSPHLQITDSTQLVIVGHSLGGGAAALMSLFLQSRFPNTCCAFDPPGETLSPGLRERSTRFITTTVFGYDIFPRVSSYTFSLLQDNIVSALCYCRLSKVRFFWLALRNRLDMRSLFYATLDEMSLEKQETLRNWLENVEIEARREG